MDTTANPQAIHIYNQRLTRFALVASLGILKVNRGAYEHCHQSRDGAGSTYQPQSMLDGIPKLSTVAWLNWF